MFEQGTLIDGKYKILSEIGHGGMSVVYLAINEKVNKTWAVKVVRKSGASTDEATARNGLITEIETLKSIKHPMLPSIVDVIEDDDQYIVVMDYIEGRSLDKIIQEKGPQSEKTVVKWASQLCEVIGYLHDQTPPIIYRDMKPANIMLKPDGNLMIIDFGTAKKYEFQEGVTQGIGTYGYAPPECFAGGHLRSDRRSDIYSMGMTFFNMLTGEYPFHDPKEECVSVRKINPLLSTGFEEIIAKCTQRDPDMRYQNCEELLFDLNNIEKIDHTYRKKAKIKIAVFFTAAVLAVGCAGGGFASHAVAAAKATDKYQELLGEADSASTSYDEKIDLCMQAIEVPNKSGQPDAYLMLMDIYKNEGEGKNKFTVSEAEQIESLIKTNQAALTANKQGYVDICFELGKLFWFYYDYGDSENNQITKAKSSVEWFQYVVDNADPSYENMSMAKVYANIGAFYRDITTNIIEASDKGKYKPFFENIKELMDSVAENNTENEMVRLELIETARSAIHQYATKFKIDGVTKEQLKELYDQVVKCLDNFVYAGNETDDIAVKKKSIQSKLDDTLKALELAYSTTKDGE